LQNAESIVRVGAKLRYDYKLGDLPYGPSVGDLVNWAKICSDNMSIMDGGNETLIPMTSDDPEVQEEVRAIVKKVLETQVAAKKKA